MNSANAATELTTVAADLRRLVQMLDSQSKLLEQCAGLTASQFLCLQVLAAQGPVSARQLSEAVSLTAGTVSLVLDRLEAKGDIERRRSEQDRRQSEVAITSSGRRRLAAAPGVLPQGFVDRFQALPASRRQALLGHLKDLVALMQPPPKETLRKT